MRISIVIPIRDEEAHLLTRMSSITQNARHAFAPAGSEVELEWNLIENGSRDRSWSALEKFAASTSNCRLSRISEGNYGLAVRTGIISSLGEWVALASLDWFEEGFFSEAMRLRADYDWIAADKSAPGCDRRKWWRRTLSGGYRTASNLLLDLPVADTHGIFLAKGDLVRAAASECVTDHGTFTTELMMRGHWRGARFKSIATEVSEGRPTRFRLFPLFKGSLSGLYALMRVKARARPLGQSVVKPARETQP